MLYRILALIVAVLVPLASAPAGAHAAPPDQTSALDVIALSQPMAVIDTTIDPFAYGVSKPCAQVAGQGGVPSDAIGAVLSVTATAVNANHLDESIGVYSSNDRLPDVSWTLGVPRDVRTATNGTIVRLGTDGRFCLHADGDPVHVVVQVIQYIKSGGSIVLFPHAWRRMQWGDPNTCYTLVGAPELDSMGSPVRSPNVIPANAAYAILLVRTVPGIISDDAMPGSISAYADGENDPGTPVTTFTPGGPASPGTAVVPIGADGAVCLATHGGMNTTVDLVILGYIRGDL